MDLEPLPNYLPDRAQRLLNIAVIDVEMGYHAHSARIHRATEDIALPQSLEKLRRIHASLANIIDDDIALNSFRLNANARDVGQSLGQQLGVVVIDI
jgi:hypothetical protein